MLSKSSRVPPSISRRSYQSICRQFGLCTSRYTDSGTPSITMVPCARPYPMLSTWARSGTVWPYSMASPPHDRSSTTRALRVSGNVYRWTATFSPTVISQCTPVSRVAA